MKFNLLYILFNSLFLLSFGQSNNVVKIKKVNVVAPFTMPTIDVPDFSSCAKFNIKDFGAVPGDKAATSQAISKAIDAANQAGGGVVIVPKGVWLTTQLHFKSNVELHFEKDAVLEFSERPEDYLPAVFSSWEAMPINVRTLPSQVKAK
jgi:polygalacturonase